MRKKPTESSPLSNDIRILYAELTTDTGMNTHQLALHTGIDLTTLRKLKYGDTSITIRTLDKFTTALGKRFTLHTTSD